ncbi:hypothetical protein PIB30_046068 [Stylosanthes scabra]|uniref:Transposase (putative) gypsy type domain-containing protein n=1 Tax=Stylosanthes scabra TaxID=79078 RepID=A0ABU6TI82_9FABA|nr:hypothetical protein [Stylosanthes scabra]
MVLFRLLPSGNSKVDGGRRDDALLRPLCIINVVPFPSSIESVLQSSSSCHPYVFFFFLISIHRGLGRGFVNMVRGDVNVKPTNVPEDMDWVDDLVLLLKSVMDEELIASFRESHAICGTISEENQYELVPSNLEERVCYYNLFHPEEKHFIYMYECLFSKLGVRVPFTQFEQDILYECRVAPSQLHPNSWGFMKAFQTVCWYLHLDISLRAFLYFFRLIQPFFSRKKSQWSSFRACEGRRIFTLYEESFHNFKNYYFKLRAVKSVRPFYENERGEY